MFGLHEFIIVFQKLLKNTNYSKEVKGNLESAGLLRLSNLIEQNSNIYDSINTVPIEDLLTQPTVLELNAIDNAEQKSLIIALLLINICLYTKHNHVGDGELKDELINRVKEKHLENLIQFLGYRSDIQNTMKQFDFVVLSSLWEGLPLTPIEAFSVGKTVIGTSVDGTPEIIEDKENGLLVNAKDVRQLSDAMNILIEDENLRKELEVNAKKCYMEEFSFDKLAKEYRDYYGRL